METVFYSYLNPIRKHFFVNWCVSRIKYWHYSIFCRYLYQSNFIDYFINVALCLGLRLHFNEVLCFWRRNIDRPGVSPSSFKNNPINIRVTQSHTDRFTTSSSSSQFHQHFTGILFAIFQVPKNYKHKLQVQKSCAKLFRSKLPVKCWWNG